MKTIHNIFQWFWRKKLIFGAVFMLLFLVSLVWLIPIFGPIKPEKASENLLLTWLTVRDFRNVPDEIRVPLANRYITTFGSSRVKKPDFNFSNFMKGQIAPRLREHQQLVKTQAKVMKKPDQLLAINLPRQEQNVQVLARTWFVCQMTHYEKLPPEQQKIFMDSFVREVKWWQSFYLDFVEAAGESAPSTLELAQEFEVMFARWRAETPDKAENLNTLKGKFQQAYLSDEVDLQIGIIKSEFAHFFSFGGGGKKQSLPKTQQQKKAEPQKKITSEPSPQSEQVDPFQVFQQ